MQQRKHVLHCISPLQQNNDTFKRGPEQMEQKLEQLHQYIEVTDNLKSSF